MVLITARAWHSHAFVFRKRATAASVADRQP